MHLLDNFYVIGFNYKDLALSDRETVVRKKPWKIIEELYAKNLIKGYVKLATCLRIELYFYKNNDFKKSLILDAIDESRYYLYNGQDAISHLFNVACGIDSVVIGENQILAQVKNDYHTYLKQKNTCPEINTIFNHAISLGKKFRHVSKIDTMSTSLERIALKVLKQHFTTIHDKIIVLIGSGEIISDVLTVLKKEKIHTIIMANRSEHKLENFIKEFGVKKICFHEVPEAVKKADVIISATSAPHYVIHAKDILPFMNGKKKIFIDLAVPRDVEESLRDHEQIELINIEDLFKTSEDNKAIREKLSGDYLYIIEEQKHKCIEWFMKRESTICKKNKSLQAHEGVF